MISIDLVLERSLASAFENSRATDETCLRACILDYVGWFNEHVYIGLKSPKSELLLSLRDVLAWSTFMSQLQRDDKALHLWTSYIQGASLMHLDGLGLGTGLAREEADDIKSLAIQYLRRQISVAGDNLGPVMEISPSGPVKLCCSDQGRYGIYPFFINTGPYPGPSSLNLNLNAPTTSANILRVLRAMQLSKPILLEGSPGTGKTR